MLEPLDLLGVNHFLHSGGTAAAAAARCQLLLHFLELLLQLLCKANDNCDERRSQTTRLSELTHLNLLRGTGCNLGGHVLNLLGL